MQIRIRDGWYFVPIKEFVANPFHHTKIFQLHESSLALYVQGRILVFSNYARHYCYREPKRKWEKYFLEHYRTMWSISNEASSLGSRCVHGFLQFFNFDHVMFLMQFHGLAKLAMFWERNGSGMMLDFFRDRVLRMRKCVLLSDALMFLCIKDYDHVLQQFNQEVVQVRGPHLFNVIVAMITSTTLTYHVLSNECLLVDISDSRKPHGCLLYVREEKFKSPTCLASRLVHDFET